MGTFFFWLRDSQLELLFFDKLWFWKQSIIAVACRLKKKQLLCVGDLFTEADPVTACDAQMQVSCSVFWHRDQVGFPEEQCGPQNQTGPWCPLLNTWQMLAAINRPFSSLASVASVECLLLNSRWKSWTIKGQMVCEVANFPTVLKWKGN